MAESRDWLATSALIARHLCATAYSHGGRATWMGTTQSEAADSGDLEFTFGTLGADLYGGASGVALFLAEVGVRTGERNAQVKAAEGIRHALARAAQLPRESRLGFYLGDVGVAYAAARIGRALDKPEFVDGARTLLAAVGPEDAATAALDIMAGAAGAAPALLVLAEWLGDARLRDIALGLGARLLETAARDESRGWSWAADDGEREGVPNLTGFSHGAGGIGWSLMRLYGATGDRRFLQGAERAFQYEDSWFRPELDNWPDFRDAEDADDPVPCGVAWCHGAPGIGLSRARAMTLVQGEAYRRDAAAALRTCVRTLASAGRDADADGSLCHGRAGVCDITLVLAALLGEDDARTMALDAAAFAADRYAGSPGAWPCGVARGTNPSLMLGLAGIGYSYLRLADPALASVLEPGG